MTYVACAPKSNSAVNAIFAANEAVRNYQTSVPAHLRDAHYKGAKNSVMAQIISYAHDYPDHYVKQQYLPDEIKMPDSMNRAYSDTKNDNGILTEDS